MILLYIQQDDMLVNFDLKDCSWCQLLVPKKSKVVSKMPPNYTTMAITQRKKQNSTCSTGSWCRFVVFVMSMSSDDRIYQIHFQDLSGKHSNVLISPVSLKLVLALLYEGSGGETAKEFQSVLGFQNKDESKDYFNKTLALIQVLICDLINTSFTSK